MQCVPIYIEIQIVPSCPVQGTWMLASCFSSPSQWPSTIIQSLIHYQLGMLLWQVLGWRHKIYECSSNNVPLPLKSCNHIFYECPSPPPSPPDKCWFFNYLGLAAAYSATSTGFDSFICFNSIQLVVPSFHGTNCCFLIKTIWITFIILNIHIVFGYSQPIHVVVTHFLT